MRSPRRKYAANLSREQFNSAFFFPHEFIFHRPFSTSKNEIGKENIFKVAIIFQIVFARILRECVSFGAYGFFFFSSRNVRMDKLLKKHREFCCWSVWRYERARVSNGNCSYLRVRICGRLSGLAIGQVPYGSL